MELLPDDLPSLRSLLTKIHADFERIETHLKRRERGYSPCLSAI
jgi:hypothetical protein